VLYKFLIYKSATFLWGRAKELGGAKAILGQCLRYYAYRKMKFVKMVFVRYLGGNFCSCLPGPYGYMPGWDPQPAIVWTLSASSTRCRSVSRVTSRCQRRPSTACRLFLAARHQRRSHVQSSRLSLQWRRIQRGDEGMHPPPAYVGLPSLNGGH